jgi:hypothetical protein
MNKKWQTEKLAWMETRSKRSYSRFPNGEEFGMLAESYKEAMEKEGAS